MVGISGREYFPSFSKAVFNACFFPTHEPHTVPSVQNHFLLKYYLYSAG